MRQGQKATGLIEDSWVAKIIAELPVYKVARFFYAGFMAIEGDKNGIQNYSL